MADAAPKLALARRAIRAARTGRPAFDRIGEIEQILKLEATWRNRAREGAANRQVARVRETTAIVERDAARRLAEDHQAKARRTVARGGKLAPWFEARTE